MPVIKHYWTGTDFIELREPVAKWHYRFLQLFKVLQDSQYDNDKYYAILKLLNDLLVQSNVVESPVDLTDIGLVNEILELFTPQEVPDLSELLSLLEDQQVGNHAKSSNDFDAHWLNSLFNLFEGKALDIWNSLSLSTIQALIFETRQGILLNSVKDKLTPEAKQNREIEKAMRQKLDAGVAFSWMQEQLYSQATDELLTLADHELNDLTLDYTPVSNEPYQVVRQVASNEPHDFTFDYPQLIDQSLQLANNELNNIPFD